MGIGIVIQDRLNRSEIKTYAQLAKATPEDLEAILGNRITGARIDDWIQVLASVCYGVVRSCFKKAAFKTASSRARGGVSAAATFHLLHLATSAKGADHLNEAVVVETEPAEKAADPVRHPVTAFRHGPNS
jgi:hypothetical protein